MKTKQEVLKGSEPTLDETWSECLRMWKWIVGQVKEGGLRYDIPGLKKEWVAKSNYEAMLWNYAYCFFCYYAERKQGRARVTCDYCPAKKIDTAFDCRKTIYDYQHAPILFYKKLLELNRIRKKSKGK